MSKYTIHFWEKKIDPKIVGEESAMVILKAKAEGGMFELSGGYYDGSSVCAVIPNKKEESVFRIEAPKGTPATKEVIDKVTKELQKKGFLRSTKE